MTARKSAIGAVERLDTVSCIWRCTIRRNTDVYRHNSTTLCFCFLTKERLNRVLSQTSAFWLVSTDTQIRFSSVLQRVCRVSNLKSRNCIVIHADWLLSRLLPRRNRKRLKLIKLKPFARFAANVLCPFERSVIYHRFQIASENKTQIISGELRYGYLCDFTCAP